MRILLIQPDGSPRSIGFHLLAMPEPLSLEILAAAVPDEEVAILDMRLDADLPGALERFGPDVVGVTALTTDVYEAREVLRSVKQYAPDIFTVVGGHHATLLPEDFDVPYVDAVCLGEGESVFPQLIEALKTSRALGEIANLAWSDGRGRLIHNRRAVPSIDADTIPLPRRDLVQEYRREYFFLFDKPITTMATNRGCPYRCDFCSVWEFYGGRTRLMTPPRVIQEMRHVGTEQITFLDDNFMMNYRRELQIADLVKAEGIKARYFMQCRTDSIVRHPELVEKWAELGLRLVLLGLEGASDGMLKKVNKSNTARTNDEAIRILQENGVIIWGAFIVDPDWEVDDFQRLREYVCRKRITHTQFTVLTPLPGTRLHRRRCDELLTRDYRCYDTLHAVVPTRLPREEFYRQLAGLYAHPSPEPALDLVRKGQLSMENLKRGYKVLKVFSQYERYLEMDPIVSGS